MSIIQTEFNRQINNLTEKDYPQAIIEKILPLRKKLDTLDLPEVDIEKGILPFVIVIKNELVSIDEMMYRIEREGKNGIVKMYPHEATDFLPIESVQVPESPAYVLIDIDRGKETINLPPNQALPIIQSKNRSPLTIEEGVAIVTHYPEFLMKNNCFSLLASRCKGNQRVPAIWINGEKRPNLGWCWDGNPHTWLGSASCKDRIGY